MTTRDYENYRAAIDTANDKADRDMLRAIQADMIKNYGLHDEDVEYLIKRFRYYI